MFSFSYLFWHIIGNEEIDIGEKEVYFLKCSNVKLSIADRIVVNLKNHGRRLQKKIKNLKGGKCRQNVFDKWKTGELCYQLKILYSELESSSMLNLINQLQNDNIESNNLVEAERNSHLEKELNYNALLTRSEEKVNCYKEKFRNLCRDDGKRGPTKSKSYGDLSRSQQFRIKKDIEKKCKEKLLFMEHFNFKATTLDIFNESKNTMEAIKLLDEEITPMPTIENLDDVNMVLLVKDKFNISDAAFKELSQLCSGMPTFHGIAQKINELNDGVHVFDTPDGSGVQVSFKQTLMISMKPLESSQPDLEELHIKFTGDGTFVGKRLHVVNFGYTILNEKRKAMSDRGNYSLAIVKIKEDYESIRDALSDLVTEMKSMVSVDFNGRQIPIIYYLGGDWKFLACVCGIGAANSDFACIWCTCPKSKRGDLSKWSMFDMALGGRTVDLITKWSGRKLFSCKHPPLFDFIPMDRVVIDTLHLFLRISDVLIDELIQELRAGDCIVKQHTFSKFDLSKYQYMAKYQQFLTSLGIVFSFGIDINTRKLEYRSLTGPEKHKLFQNIDISHLLPSDYRFVEDVQKLWHDFYALYCRICTDYINDGEISQLQEDILAWLKLFLDCYATKDVTPYIHAFANHVCEFLYQYHNISNYQDVF